MNEKPLFSILHPSARPDRWRDIFNAWMNAAIDPKSVQYVLCADERWGFKRGFDALGLPNFYAVWNIENYHHSGYVSAVNHAAHCTNGSILIVIADDQYPCHGWDKQIIRAIEKARRGTPDAALFLHGEWVLEVSTNTVQEHERGIMVMPILSRERYEKLGYVFYSEYESMFADNDFCEHARQDGVVLDGRDLVFPHDHPLIPLEQKHLGQQTSRDVWDREVKGWDRQYQAQHDPENYAIGRRILEKRRVSRFGRNDLVGSADSAVSAGKPRQKRIISLVLPGDSFSKEYLGMVMGLQQWLSENDWAPFVHQAASSVVYFTRQILLESVLAQDPVPEYVLWLDHDNLLSRDHFKLLLDDLEANPDIDSVAGWYWIDNHDGTFFTSVGVRDAAGQIGYAGGDIAFASGLVDCAWHGFGCVLMRHSCLDKAGDYPFLPRMMPESRHRMTGEDVSFCLNAAELGGAKLVIDPRVHVPHLKRGMIQPPVQTKEPVIIATIRAKNEAANIERCIESVKSICKEVLVLDDHSSDLTARIAASLGARVYPSDFKTRDEGRDRHFLLEAARQRGADWIFAIDADEALDPRDIPALLNACQHSDCEALHLRWMNLWNSDSQVRVDGIYGKGSPPRLWRVTPFLRLHSISNGVHTWSATNVKRGFVDVRLWHWGYRDREQRIARWQWYNTMDPNNLSEDRYRHQVQGDIPEVPADAKLMKAGPLELRDADMPAQFQTMETQNA